MSGPPVPQYGNFGGNGDNDAWEQADRYATFTANNYNIASLVGGPPGSGNLPDPRDFHAPITVHVTRSAENVAFVKAVLADIDRQPKNDADTAYLNHDLGFVPDSAITNIANNNAMGVSVWNALISGNSQMDAMGYIYGAASIPFIVGPGSAFNVLTEAKTQTPTPPTFVADTIYVTAQNPQPNNIIELTFNFIGSNSVVTSLVNIAQDSWSNFSSAMGSGYSSITSALGNAWSWFSENVFGDGSDPERGSPSSSDYDSPDKSNQDPSTPELGQSSLLWGDLTGVKVEYVKVSAGESIDINDLSGYDDNGDGFLTLGDKIVTSLGIGSATDIQNSTGHETFRGFTVDDSIDVKTGRDAQGDLVVVVATKEFYNAVNVGHSSSAARDETYISDNFATDLPIDVSGSEVTSDLWLV